MGSIVEVPRFKIFSNIMYPLLKLIIRQIMHKIYMIFCVLLFFFNQMVMTIGVIIPKTVN